MRRNPPGRRLSSGTTSGLIGVARGADQSPSYLLARHLISVAFGELPFVLLFCLTRNTLLLSRNVSTGQLRALFR